MTSPASEQASHSASARSGPNNQPGPLNGGRSPGRPDLVLPRYQTVVFVHGCFWHGHGCSLFKLPATRTEFGPPRSTRTSAGTKQRWLRWPPRDDAAPGYGSARYADADAAAGRLRPCGTGLSCSSAARWASKLSARLKFRSDETEPVTVGLVRTILFCASEATLGIDRLSPDVPTVVETHNRRARQPSVSDRACALSHKRVSKKAFDRVVFHHVLAVRSADADRSPHIRQHPL